MPAAKPQLPCCQDNCKKIMDTCHSFIASVYELVARNYGVGWRFPLHSVLRLSTQRHHNKSKQTEHIVIDSVIVTYQRLYY